MAPIRRTARATAAALALLLTAGCISIEARAPARTAAAATTRADVGTVAERVYFGRAIPGGGEVNEAQWQAFVADTIVPRFPDGFTLWRAEGHWRGDDGTPVREPTMVLEVIHPGDAASDRAVAEIADMYRRRFSQEAVLRVRAPIASELLRR